MKKKVKKIQMIFDIENWLESQILALFDTSLLHQFAKLNDFIWLQLIIFKQKPFLFCIPALKTPQPVLPFLTCWRPSYFFIFFLFVLDYVLQLYKIYVRPRPIIP